MSPANRVPLAEHFHSIQGEGAFVGTPMHFIRFAGCTVGKVQVKEEGYALKVLPTQAPAKVCTAFDGQNFFCDTDYSLKESLTPYTIISETHEDIACFTGGEPLMHQDKPWYSELLKLLRAKRRYVHVETSGTIAPNTRYDWLTVSPKAGWKEEVIKEANQLKFLITPETRATELAMIVRFARPECLVYLSPIFDPNHIVPENLNAVLEILRAFPQWRLGVQWHKFLGLR